MGPEDGPELILVAHKLIFGEWCAAEASILDKVVDGSDLTGLVCQYSTFKVCFLFLNVFIWLTAKVLEYCLVILDAIQTCLKEKVVHSVAECQVALAAVLDRLCSNVQVADPVEVLIA